MTDFSQRRHQAHMVDVMPSSKGVAVVKCRDCEFGGRYPGRPHARAVADEHIIRTHVTGAALCGVAYCLGDAALRRRPGRQL